MVKPALRTKSIGFKVSEEEYAQLETAAQAGGGGGGAPPAPPAPPPTPDQLPRTGRYGSINNETLGLPPGISLRIGSLGDLFGLNPNGPCDFGVCAPIGGNFSAGTIAIGAAETVGEGALSAASALAGLLGILLMQTGDNPPHHGGECILTGEAKEGNVIQCWYSCPKPGGNEVIKWQWAKNGSCPGFANENDLRALMKK
jgi:hypothetical protein